MVNLKQQHRVPQKPSPAHGRVPAEYDLDWEYTGVEYRCPDCGYRIEETESGVDFCPACGTPAVLSQD
jgi:rubrerythrin